MTKKELTPEQIGAMIRSIKLGKILQQEHFEIANLYKQGHILSQIIKELNIPSNYRVSYDIAWSGVRLAIAGYPGGFSEIDSYGGLININERKIISKEHRQEYGKKTGKRNYEEKKGIHGQTPEERRDYARNGGNTVYKEKKGIHARTLEQMSEDGRKGGIIGGPISGPMTYKQKKGIHGRTTEEKREDARKGGNIAYKEKKGIHGRTPEQMSEDGRKGAKKGGKIGGPRSVISRGLTLWTDEEKEFVYQLSRQPEYQWSNGTHKGKSNLKKITQELIKRGYANRTLKAIQIMISIYKKSLEDRV